MEITGLDQTDNQIIELLRDDARLSYSEIGKIVGLSRVTVKRRMNLHPHAARSADAIA